MNNSSGCWFWMVPGNWKKHKRLVYRVVPEARPYLNEVARINILNVLKLAILTPFAGPFILVSLLGQAADDLLNSCSPPKWLRLGDRLEPMRKASTIVPVDEVRRRMTAAGWNYK